MVAHLDRERVHAGTAQARRTLLTENHQDTDGVWLISWRTATGKPRVGYPEAVEEALVANANGSWTLLDDVENLLLPTDLELALHRKPGARGHWDAFPRSARRGIPEWIVQARTPATRASRVTETAEKAARGERANQWPRT